LPSAESSLSANPLIDVMGMTGGLFRTREAEIQRLREDSEALAGFLEGSAWAPPVRQVRPRGIRGWLLRLTPITIEEVDPDAEPPPGAKLFDETHCDLDKAWQALHFLLTGTAWEGEPPACYLVCGGEALGDPDEIGFSVIQALTSQQVRDFAEFLNGLSHDELRRRFDLEKMIAAGVYPKPARSKRVDLETWRAELERLVDAFDDLKTFVNGAANDGDAAVVYVA
jgi:uncharacterized protein DUF1877